MELDVEPRSDVFRRTSGAKDAEDGGIFRLRGVPNGFEQVGQSEVHPGKTHHNCWWAGVCPKVLIRLLELWSCWTPCQGPRSFWVLPCASLWSSNQQCDNLPSCMSAWGLLTSHTLIILSLVQNLSSMHLTDMRFRILRALLLQRCPAVKSRSLWTLRHTICVFQVVKALPWTMSPSWRRMPRCSRPIRCRVSRRVESRRHVFRGGGRPVAGRPGTCRPLPRPGAKPSGDEEVIVYYAILILDRDTEPGRKTTSSTCNT